jgi:hypothetical protein
LKKRWGFEQPAIEENSVDKAIYTKKKSPFDSETVRGGKGVVISPPVSISSQGALHIETSAVDPVELRRSVLFWDRIVRPSNSFIQIALSRDEEFLKGCGVLRELSGSLPHGGTMGHAYAQSHLKVFSDLEDAEPGLWALSEGPNSFQLEASTTFKQGRGALVELHRAIPLPAQDVPLHDLLEFREKWKGEIRDLTLELDGIFVRLAKAEDPSFELQRAISDIAQICAVVVALGKESNVAFRLSDFSFGISLEEKFTGLMAAAGIGETIGRSFGLPLVGAFLGVASQAKIKLSLGGKITRNNKVEELALSPFRVASRLTNEPI